MREQSGKLVLGNRLMKTSPEGRLEVFKFQRSIFPRGMCLVYNESRSIQGDFPTTNELAEMFDLHGDKFYGLGKYNNETNQVELYNCGVTNPGW